MRKFLPILLALIMSIGIVSLNQQLEYNTYANLELNTIQEEAIIEQAVISVSPNINTIQKVYMKEQLIGVLSEQANIDAFLRDVYAERYAQDFPNTSLGFGEDIFVTLEESYMSYENKDSDILSYLRNQDYFSVEADKVAFSNGAVIYVKSIELFEQAKDLYLQNFISKEALDLIRINKLPPELVTYGTRDIGFNVIEKANYQRGMAPAAEIMTTIPQIVYFLSYGYGTEIETYTVIEYDTVEGIAGHRLFDQLPGLAQKDIVQRLEEFADHERGEIALEGGKESVPRSCLCCVQHLAGIGQRPFVQTEHHVERSERGPAGGRRLARPHRIDFAERS